MNDIAPDAGWNWAESKVELGRMQAEIRSDVTRANASGNADKPRAIAKHRPVVRH